MLVIYDPVQTAQGEKRRERVLAVNVDGEVGRRVADGLSDLLDDAGDTNVVNLVRLDEGEADDVRVDLVVSGALRARRISQRNIGTQEGVHKRALHKRAKEEIRTKSLVRSPPWTLVPLLMHPSRLACQKKVPWVMADWFDTIPV